MKHYIGIDLGTTNSVICSYDGTSTHVWKSPDQNDITPSAIYAGRRGKRYYGRQAYDMAPADEKNAATLFKRYMGTTTRFELEKAGVTLTPEECSAEILRVLFGYLPEEIRNDPETVTVITVPAAFNQVKKDATLEAARMAGLGAVALMQEPVAAVMSAVHRDNSDGIFVVYDLGGGTFDVSIAENMGGRVSLLAQGGREMCGGRDWDRQIFERIVQPWLQRHFSLPASIAQNEAFRPLYRQALYAVEQAKITLSMQEETFISMDEQQLRCEDLNGKEIYLDVPFDRAQLNGIIEPVVLDTVEVVRDTLRSAGVSLQDVERVVFIGGPSCYKPLRDRVCIELGVSAGADMNPMTAVAMGASIFAESIDWSSQHHNRKASLQEVAGEVALRYEKRTSADTARVAVLAGEARVYVTIRSMDSDWQRERMEVNGSAILELPLELHGENRFSIEAFTPEGEALPLAQSSIVIHRTMATINAIPASCSVAIKALNKLGGETVPVYLVMENDPLPKKGSVVLKAGEALKAGSEGALQFTLWEGSIVHPIEDNRYIGLYKIPASSFDEGIVPVGADIVCTYEMADSGALHLGVSIPCIKADFGSRNFYSRQEGQVDLNNTDAISREGASLLQRIEEIASRVSDARIARARAMAAKAAFVHKVSADQEAVQAAHNDMLEARKLVAKIRRDHLRDIRQMDLDALLSFFDREVKQHAQPAEMEMVERLRKTAQQAIDHNSPDFEQLNQELDNRMFNILWKQDWYVVKYFNHLTANPEDYTDQARFQELDASGREMIRSDYIGQLRSVCMQLIGLRAPRSADTEEMFAQVNVIKG